MSNPEHHPAPEICPMCGTENPRFLLREKGRQGYLREFYKCPNCRLIFVPVRFQLEPDEEKGRYDLHENDPEDADYRAFLNRLFEPMIRKPEVNPESRKTPPLGLDFGSGPGPTLHLMFEEAGCRMKIFDLFYANDPSVFDCRYDFIVSSETVEHLSRPLHELERLWKSLKPGGWFGIMTQMIPEDGPFETWHYKNDDTHITFFDQRTFHWLADRWGTGPEFSGDRVVLMRKPDGKG